MRRATQHLRELSTLSFLRPILALHRGGTVVQKLLTPPLLAFSSRFRTFEINLATRWSGACHITKCKINSTKQIWSRNFIRTFTSQSKTTAIPATVDDDLLIDVDEAATLPPDLASFSSESTSLKRKPLVALVGRPNVGKSSLFNRIVGQSRSLVHPTPGTTRDRIYGSSVWNGREFNIVDTGGIVDDKEFFSPYIREQALIAIDEADIILFMVDAVEGVTRGDRDVAQILRQSNKSDKVILVANKADSQLRVNKVSEGLFKVLDLGEPMILSALHGDGTGDVLDEVVRRFPETENDVDEKQSTDTATEVTNNAPKLPAGSTAKKPIATSSKKKRSNNYVPPHIAILGQPNVGKSSLLNAVLGQQRVIVSEKPGTTRDTIDIKIKWRRFSPLKEPPPGEAPLQSPPGMPSTVVDDVTLVDTAGITRRSVHKVGLERSAVLWALKALDRCHVALLMIDATVGVNEQDKKVAGHILEAGKGVVVVINKWDLVEGRAVPNDTIRKDKASFERYVRQELRFVEYIPIVFTSATKGVNIDVALDLALEVYRERLKLVPTRQLIDVITKATLVHKPPHNLKIRFATQVKPPETLPLAAAPPGFVFFVNDPERVHPSFARHMENVIRTAFGFSGTPLRLFWRKSEAHEKRERLTREQRLQNPDLVKRINARRRKKRIAEVMQKKDQQRQLKKEKKKKKEEAKKKLWAERTHH